jgi:hypothetical protein
MVGMNGSDLELRERLKVIEDMIAEGRHGQESWGWSFVLWGVAYCIATAWATWGHSNLAWPVTMIAAGIVTSIVATRMGHGHPETTLGRAIGAVWMAMGISLMVVLVCLAVSGRYDAHVFVAIVGAMLATAHATSAIVLRWKMQFGCALVWLAACVTACFGSDTAVAVAFFGATFFGQILFGIYAMILESRRRKQREAAHA